MKQSTWIPKSILSVVERDPFLSRRVTNRQFKKEGLTVDSSFGRAEKLNIKIKKLSETAQIPTKASEYAAGYDLYAGEDIKIWSNTTEMIPTNLAVEIPEGYFGAIYARSGLAAKRGLRPANCVGVIDSDYRGGIVIALRNDSNHSQNIKKGDRIAQLVIQPYAPVEFHEVIELDCSERGSCGFGSTGV